MDNINGIEYNIIQTLPAMNKENLNRNISVLLYKKPSLNPKQQNSLLSFRNLNTKSFHKKQNRQETSVSPINKRNKTILHFGQNSPLNSLPVDNSSYISTQNNSNLIDTLRLQRQSLVNTLKMYKEQMGILNSQNSKLKKQMTKYHLQFKQQQEELTFKQQTNIQLTNKVNQYQNMLPKVIELEQLQEKMIEDNSTLKNKIKVQEALLTNVANLAKTQEVKSTVLDKIRVLTQPFQTIGANRPQK